MRTALRSLAIAGVAALAAVPALAGSITVYEDANFGGRSTTITNSTANLDGTGWNDIISSIVVNSGTWEICKNSSYQGCQTVQGRDVRNLSSVGMNDAISSIREISGSRGDNDNSCRWANNGRCDETGRGDFMSCPRGTDSSDCRGGRPGGGGALGGVFWDDDRDRGRDRDRDRDRDDDYRRLRYDEGRAERVCESAVIAQGYADAEDIEIRGTRRSGDTYRVEWSDGYRRGSCRVDGNTLRTQVDGTRR